MDKPQVYTVVEAGKILKIGRTASYEAARRGDIPTIRIGSSLRVPAAALQRMLEESSSREDRRDRVDD